MAKKSTTPKQPKQLDGVEQIIDYLVRNREHIGAIVIGTAPIAGRRLPKLKKDGECDGIYAAADRVLACNDQERDAVGVCDQITDGIAANIAKRHLQRESLFG